MTPRIETIEETPLVGMRLRMPAPPETTAALWAAFMPRAGTIARRVGGDVLSMQVFDLAPGAALTPETPFDRWAAVEVEADAPAPEGMERFVLPGGTYAVFVHRGPVTTFARTARHIFGTWLPGSNYELDDRPHFERLPPGYRPDAPDAEEEVWIPVRSAG